MALDEIKIGGLGASRRRVEDNRFIRGKGNYVDDIVEKQGEDGKCLPMAAKPAQTAAQIIYEVARACSINPKVLLVTLQKEQGLIQSVNPTPYMYKAAMGFGCLALFGVLGIDRALVAGDTAAGDYQALFGDGAWYKRVR